MTNLVILASEGGRYRLGGVARHVNEVAKSLSLELAVTVVVVPSYCLSVIPEKQSVEEETIAGVRYIYAVCPAHIECLRASKFDLNSYRAAASLLRALVEPHLPSPMHSLLLEDHYETGLAFELRNKCEAKNFVLFSHLPLSSRFSYFEKGPDESRQQVLESAAMIGSKAILVPTEYALRTIRNVYPVPGARVKVIPLGVHGDFSENSPIQPRASSVLTVARFSDQKGWDGFLEVARSIEDRGLSPRWHLVGDGTHRLEVVERLQTFVPKSRIFADRHLDAESRLPCVMKKSPVFFLPSAYETFGLAPLEAAAHGAVPVVSAVGGLQEIWGESGLTFSPGDLGAAQELIEKLLLDDDFWMAQSKAAMNIAKPYCWEEHCSRLKGILIDG